MRASYELLPPSMIPSTALVLLNDVDLDLRMYSNPRVDERQMRLTRGSLSDPATGRTLAQVYSRFSRTCELQANRTAHRLDRGPSATANRIETFFGTGEQREDKLEELRANVCPWLEGKCSHLLKYALPSETVRTQVQAFKSIVTIVTQYNGTRKLFLRSKHLERARNTEFLISALWARVEDDIPPQDWHFYCNLAATCLSDTDISSILADLSPKRLGCVHTGTGVLSVLEHILITSERGCVIKLRMGR
ncbi:hypothetical protein FB451DRAFT_1438889 [Mycena latifolia]|nr:hypothetical protein FB451DRAFT_1438889 [Mycena latifolia]